MTALAVPMMCVVCRTRGSYYGRLVFPDELPPSAEMYDAVAAGGGYIVEPAPLVCPNHPAGMEPFLVRPVITKRSI